MQYIGELQEKGKVAMIGDGLNDSGALKQSDLGIVITEGTNNFTPASDIIFRAEKFNLLPSFLIWAKGPLDHWWGLFDCSDVQHNWFGLCRQCRIKPGGGSHTMPLSSLTIVIYTVSGSALLVRWKLKNGGKL